MGALEDPALAAGGARSSVIAKFAAPAQILAFAGLVAAAQSVPIAEFAAKIQKRTFSEVAARRRSLEVSTHAANIDPRSQFFPTQIILPHSAMIIATEAAVDSIDISTAGASGGPAARSRTTTAGAAISIAAHRPSAIAL